MVAFVLSFWCFLGVIFLNKRDLVGWCGSCVGRKRKKCGSSSFMSILNNLEDEK